MFTIAFSMDLAQEPRTTDPPTDRRVNFVLLSVFPFLLATVTGPNHLQYFSSRRAFRHFLYDFLRGFLKKIGGNGNRFFGR